MAVTQLDAIGDVVALLEAGFPGCKIERAQSEKQVDGLQTANVPTIIVFPGRRIGQANKRWGFKYQDSVNTVVVQIQDKDPEIYDLCVAVERLLEGSELQSCNNETLRWSDENLKEVRANYLTFIQQYTYFVNATS